MYFGVGSVFSDGVLCWLPDLANKHWGSQLLEDRSDTYRCFLRGTGHTDGAVVCDAAARDAQILQ